MKKIIDLGEILVNMLIRFKVEGDKKEDIIDIISLFKSLGLDELEAREARRGFERISDIIAASCRSILKDKNLQEEQIERIIDNVIIAYEKLNLSIEDFLSLQMDETKLKKSY